jgi:hypothetical protein
MLSARARRSHSGGDRALLPEVALLWRQAATSLRASQDLLDTHRSPDFGWRSPDAWLVDHVKPQAAATESVAGFLRAIAGSGQALALRAREVDRAIDCSDILDAAALRLAAASLTHYARQFGGIAALDELRAIRDAQGQRVDALPLGVAVHAVTELRHQAWQHARSGHVSIRTVGIYAALAMSVYQHASVIAGAGATQGLSLGGGVEAVAELRRSSELSTGAANSWAHVRRMCVALRATAVPSPDVYELVLAVRAQLEALTRDGVVWRAAAAILPDADTANRVFTQLRQLVAPMEEISAWHADAVARMAGAGQLYISANDLGREQLSDDQGLAAAVLSRRPVPLPQRQTTELLDAFTHADDATWAAAPTFAEFRSFGRLQRPALARMRELHRSAGRPAVRL